MATTGVNRWAVLAVLAGALAVISLDNTIVNVDIPYRDWINPSTGKSEGFEDYSPYYTPQFAMFYGLVGSTMEVSYKSDDGVDAHYYGILEGAKYTADHRKGMLTNQVGDIQYNYDYSPAEGLTTVVSEARVVHYDIGKPNATPNWPLSLGSSPFTAGTYRPRPLAMYGNEPMCGLITPPVVKPSCIWIGVRTRQEPGSADTSVLVAVKYVPQPSTEVFSHLSW